MFCQEPKLFLLDVGGRYNTASQERGQQQAFVLLADSTAAVAVYWGEYDFYGYRCIMQIYSLNCNVDNINSLECIQALVRQEYKFLLKEAH